MKDDIDDLTLISDPALAKELNKSLRSFARWDADPNSTFPRPIYIHRRKHRRVKQVEEWLRACALEAIDKQPGAVSKSARQAPATIAAEAPAKKPRKTRTARDA